MNQLLLYIVLGYGAYYAYKKYYSNEDQYTEGKASQPIVINEKDLMPVLRVPHDKSNNPLYDNNGKQVVKINHTFSDNVMPQIPYNQLSHPYSTQTAYF